MGLLQVSLRKEASTYHFVTINISIDMRLISLFIVCTVITRGVPQLRRIEAKIADNFESGTDCDVRLKLKNPGKTGSCRTKVLDEPHINNWARAGTEVTILKVAAAPDGNPERICSLKSSW